MKPHLYLKKSWQDCGYTYRQWCCVTIPNKGIFHRGFGATPEAAYDDWARQVAAERLWSKPV